MKQQRGTEKNKDKYGSEGNRIASTHYFNSCLGAVLIFLPGLAEIQALYNRLQSNAMFNNRHSKRYVLIYF